MTAAPFHSKPRFRISPPPDVACPRRTSSLIFCSGAGGDLADKIGRPSTVSVANLAEGDSLKEVPIDLTRLPNRSPDF